MSRPRTYIAIAITSVTFACGGGSASTGQPALNSGNDAGAELGTDAGEDAAGTSDAQPPSIQARFVGSWSGNIRAFFNEKKQSTPMLAVLREDGTCDITDLEEMQAGGPQTYSNWNWLVSGETDGPTFAAPWVLSMSPLEGETWENISLEVVLIGDQSFTVHQTTQEGTDELTVLNRVE